MGIQRCYWYAWDNHNWSTLDLTSPAKNQMTKAGAAYSTMRDWLLGANLRSCVREPSGVWTCSFDRAGSASWIVWSDQRTQSFALPAGWQIRSLIAGQAKYPRPVTVLQSDPPQSCSSGTN